MNIYQLTFGTYKHCEECGGLFKRARMLGDYCRPCDRLFATKLVVNKETDFVTANAPLGPLLPIETPRKKIPFTKKVK